MSLSPPPSRRMIVPSPGVAFCKGDRLKFDRDMFIAECRRSLDEDEPQLAVRDVVARAISNPAAVERERGVADGWRVEVLYNDEDLTIMHFVWPPSVDLFPHEHKMWSTVGIYGGIEDNTYYRRAGHSIEANGYRRGEVGDVLLMGVDGIHSVQTARGSGPQLSTSTEATSSPTRGCSGTPKPDRPSRSTSKTRAPSWPPPMRRSGHRTSSDPRSPPRTSVTRAPARAAQPRRTRRFRHHPCDG